MCTKTSKTEWKNGDDKSGVHNHEWSCSKNDTRRPDNRSIQVIDEQSLFECALEVWQNPTG